MQQVYRRLDKPKEQQNKNTGKLEKKLEGMLACLAN